MSGLPGQQRAARAELAGEGFDGRAHRPAQRFDILKTRFGIARKPPGQKVAGDLREVQVGDLIEGIKLLFNLLDQHLLLGGAGEGAAAAQELKEHHADGVKIGPGSQVFARDLLRRHIIW